MTLENIVLYSHIHNYNTPFPKEIIYTLKKYDVMTAQELENLVLSGNKEFQQDYYKYILNYAYRTLNEIKQGIIYNKTYNLNYPQDNYYLNILNKADQETKAQSLIIINPIGTSKLPYELNKINIKLVKYLLENYSLDGQNALIASIYGLGSKKIFDFIKGLDFYNKFMLEVVLDNPHYSGNLFLKDQKAKLALANAKIDLILDTLAHHKQFIWGTLSPSTINLLRSLAKIDTNLYYPDWRYKRFINYISNYTTLEELSSDVALKLALNRFIK